MDGKTTKNTNMYNMPRQTSKKGPDIWKYTTAAEARRTNRKILRSKILRVGFQPLAVLQQVMLCLG
jgi:hypothetical protein